jgi:hypothetical protein
MTTRVEQPLHDGLVCPGLHQVVKMVSCKLPLAVKVQFTKPPEHRVQCKCGDVMMLQPRSIPQG